MAHDRDVEKTHEVLRHDMASYRENGFGTLCVSDRRRMIREALRYGILDLDPYRDFMSTIFFRSPYMYCSRVYVCEEYFHPRYERLLVQCKAWLWHEHVSLWYLCEYMKSNPHQCYFVRHTVLDECVRAKRMPRRYLVMHQDAIDYLIAYGVQFTWTRCQPRLEKHADVRLKKLNRQCDEIRAALLSCTSLPEVLIQLLVDYVFFHHAKKT